MRNILEKGGIEVFSTCPQSKDVKQQEYLQNVIDVARWSEANGCKGILVYTDNGIVDPWLVSEVIISNTERLCPLVAIQPVYMHPYTVAKMITTFSYLHGRQIYLNMVAGGFRNDLIALNDNTPHDRRYDRLTEYTLIIKKLLESKVGVTFKGEFYEVHNLKLTPPLPPELLPGIFVSGSSEAGLAASKAIGATAVQYPKPYQEYQDNPPESTLNCGVRVGIIARQKSDAAWKEAHERFPGDRGGQIAHQLAMKVSDSSWHKQLSDLADQTEGGNTPYWMFPFQNYKTFCPYLVGDYQRVAEEVAGYISVGYKTFILDIPANEEELNHIGVVFEKAVEMVAHG